jgi:hypothetical protein
MAAHMHVLSSCLRLPEDQDASDSLSFFSDLITRHCQRNEEAKNVNRYLKSRAGRQNRGRRNHQDNPDGASIVTDNGQNSGQDGKSGDPSSPGAITDDCQNCSQEANKNDKADDNVDDSADDSADENADDNVESWAMELVATVADKQSESSDTPWSVICKRWIMSLVDHFASIRVLERACAKFQGDQEINFTLLGVDQRRVPLPDWNIMEDFLRQLTFAEPQGQRDKYIADLKATIKTYEMVDSIPGTADCYRNNVLLPFRNQLDPTKQQKGKKQLKPGSPPTTVTLASCLHCEATLMAVMTYLATDPKHVLGDLLQAHSHFLPTMIVG